MTDINKTQHYSKNELLLDGLSNLIPLKVNIIEPFYGHGDLVKNFEVKEFYDIAFPEDSPQYRDTLLSPPSYKGKWVITNPPYLAKNKAKDKTIFDKYPYDDLYKIALSTMLESEGGILVIPLNFFTDEKSKEIRNLFLSKFQILRLNVYLTQMFDETAYNVCSFVFKKQENDSQEIPVFLYENGECISKNFSFSLSKAYNYRVGGEFFFDLKRVKNIFTRLTEEKPENPTHITIICIDKTNEPLGFSYTEKPYYGKKSDRNIATLSTKVSLTIEEEKEIIEKANQMINYFRHSTHDLVFTNFRDRSRKRIGFTEAYQFASLAYQEIKKS